MSERLSSKYPYYEKLPTARIPADIAAFVVQHRFRTAAQTWPLVQIGPGIVTLNDGVNYKWSDFKQRAIDLLQAVFATHPQKADIQVESVLLRYMDAESFDFNSENALMFLREKLKVNVELPKALFEGERVRSQPEGLNLQMVHACTRPKGTINLTVATGQHQDRKAVIWDTSVLSRGEAAPRLPDDAETWLDAAHSLTHDWFFKLIEGELLGRYSASE